MCATHRPASTVRRVMAQATELEDLPDALLTDIARRLVSCEMCAHALLKHNIVARCFLVLNWLFVVDAVRYHHGYMHTLMFVKLHKHMSHVGEQLASRGKAAGSQSLIYTVEFDECCRERQCTRPAYQKTLTGSALSSYTLAYSGRYHLANRLMGSCQRLPQTPR